MRDLTVNYCKTVSGMITVSHLVDMKARLILQAQDKVMVPTGVPTVPTRTVWKPVKLRNNYQFH